jgi:hypothetical protein
VPRKKQEQGLGDQILNVTCHNCGGEIEVAVGQIKKDFRPICPTCGTPYDSKKSRDRIRSEAEPLFRPLRELVGKYRAERRDRKDKRN